MIRFMILFGFAFMFYLLHDTGNINKYINMKYSYLSISAIIILTFLSIFEFVRAYRRQSEAEHIHTHHQDHGHSHGHTSKLKRTVSYIVLIFPIFTGIFVPAQTLDSSFVKAKGFSFPALKEDVNGTPGIHQFLRPDSSVFYGKESYEEVKDKETSEFINRKEITLTDEDYLKGLEVIYNSPNAFMGKTIRIDGFAYKGEQADDRHFFIFRFGFIHCAADSGVFGMLAKFPRSTDLEDDDWVRVTGKLTWEMYQPFKQTIPVLEVTSWSRIDAPEDPYVYRIN